MINYFFLILMILFFIFGFLIFINANKLFGLLVLSISFFSAYFLIFPYKFIVFSNILGLEKGLDLVIYVLFIAVLCLILHIHFKFEAQNQLITKLAREFSIEKAKKSKYFF